MDEWESNFEAEIRHAQEARDQGNEGKARVCARRAAGVVIGAYFSSQNVSTSSASAYERLVQLNREFCQRDQPGPGSFLDPPKSKP